MMMKCYVCQQPYQRMGYLLWCGTCNFGVSALPVQSTQGLHHGMLTLKEETSKDFTDIWLPRWNDAIKKSIPASMFKEVWLVAGAGTGIVVNALRNYGVISVGYEPRKAIFGMAQQTFKTADLLVDVPSTNVKHPVMIFWNCFLEIPSIERLLTIYEPQYIMMDIPIFVDDLKNIFGWKYYLPGELQYYFTPTGCEAYLEWLGYKVVKVQAGEPVVLTAEKI